MHIWYCHPYAGGPGIGRGFRPFAFCKAWQKMGHQVTLITAQWHHLLDPGCEMPFDQTVEGVRYLSLAARRYEGNGLGRLLNMWDYTRELWNLGKSVPQVLAPADVIVCSSPHLFSIYPGSRLAKLFSAKLIFETRDIWPLAITEFTGTAPHHPFVLLCKTAERYAHRHADGIVSLFPGFPEYCQKNNLKHAPFLWAPNGADTAPIKTQKPKSETGSKLFEALIAWKQQERFVIVYPGTLGPPNAMHVFIEAFAFLKKTGISKPLGIILGTGICLNDLKKQAEGLENVIFYDPIPKQEVFSVLTACDLGYVGYGTLQNASLYDYGLSSNKIFDYMRAKKPILCALTAAHNPISESGCGVVVPPENPEALAAEIVAMMNRSDAERAEMGQKGYEHLCSTYDYEKTAEKYSTFMQEL